MMTFKDRFDRRSFLKLAGCASIASAMPLVSPAIGLASLDKKYKVAQQTRMMMGTLVAVTVVDQSTDLAQKAIVKCFASMEKLAPVFDRHAKNGLLAKLNKTGSLHEIPGVMKKVLDLSSAVHATSGGAFDITVAPVLDAYKKAHAKGSLPTDSQINQALASMGSIRRTANSLELTADGAAMTLDGVAKGFIADKGIQTLAKLGVKHALINAGGDVAVLGQRAPGRSWRVAVADPNNPKKAKLMVEMVGGALATSGNYEVYFDKERLFHHIINPETGHSPVTDVSASVRAPSAAVADAFSTACFVMQPNKAMAMLRNRPNLEGMILTRHQQRYMTQGFTA